uniref:Digalactosyldiacylglycerol synthase 1 n=1 Tax=Arundo donax TaxID=35708 RepID=A0A0A9GCG8_ARUDO
MAFRIAVIPERSTRRLAPDAPGGHPSSARDENCLRRS